MHCLAFCKALNIPGGQGGGENDLQQPVLRSLRSQRPGRLELNINTSTTCPSTFRSFIVLCEFQFQSPQLFLFNKRNHFDPSPSTWRFVVDFTMQNTRVVCTSDCDGVDWKFALWLSYKITMKLTHDAVQSWA